jgi:hypothetical protein
MTHIRDYIDRNRTKCKIDRDQTKSPTNDDSSEQINNESQLTGGSLAVNLVVAAQQPSQLPIFQSGPGPRQSNLKTVGKARYEERLDESSVNRLAVTRAPRFSLTLSGLTPRRSSILSARRIPKNCT